MGIDRIKRKIARTADGVADKAQDAASAAAGKARELGGVAAEKAKERGEIVAVAAKDGFLAAKEKAHDAQQAILEKYYRPLMPEEYLSPEFEAPHVLLLADPAEREGIEVCQGAMGWLDTKSGLEMLFMYEPFAADSGLRFEPYPELDAIYYQHPHDRDRFIKLAGFGEAMQEERVAELEHIAHSLGAKRYKIEIWEEAKSMTRKSGGLKAKITPALPMVDDSSTVAEGSLDVEYGSSGYSQRSTFCEAEFETGSEPQMPNLKWFKHDKKIEQLISTRMNNGLNKSKKYVYKASGAVTQSMDISTAGKIDGMLKALKVDCNFSMDGEMRAESRRTMCMEIEF